MKSIIITVAVVAILGMFLVPFMTSCNGSAVSKDTEEETRGMDTVKPVEADNTIVPAEGEESMENIGVVPPTEPVEPVITETQDESDVVKENMKEEDKNISVKANEPPATETATFALG